MRLRCESAVPVLLRAGFGPEPVPSEGTAPGSTYPAGAGSGLALRAEQGLCEPVVRILSEDADPLRSQGCGPAESVPLQLPGLAERLLGLEAVAQEAPRVLLGRGFELLPILEDLFQHSPAVRRGDFEPHLAGPSLEPLAEFLLGLVHRWDFELQVLEISSKSFGSKRKHFQLLPPRHTMYNSRFLVVPLILQQN